MEGVTTAIVAFLFVCIIFPSLVKSRPQYYAALGMVLGIVFLHSIAVLAGNLEFMRVTGGLIGLLQVGAILMLILAAGGLSVRQLTDDAMRTIEVMRRGEEEKEILIKPARPAAQPASPVGPGASPVKAPQRQVVRDPNADRSIPLDE